MLSRAGPRIRRALPSLLALASFLGASWGDARGVDPCPHHDGIPGMRAAHAVRAADPAADPRLAHSSMHEAMGGGTPDHPSGEGHGDHGPCKCVGCCDVGGHAVATRLTFAVVLPLPEISFAPAAPAARAAHRSAARWSPYLPNAPPLPV